MKEEKKRKIKNEINDFISKKDLMLQDFTKSKIINCSITNNENILISNKDKYMSILIDIYKSMSIDDILARKNSSINVKQGNEHGNNGYIYYSDLRLSVQGKPATITLKEIINMVELNNYRIIITIILANTNQIIYKNY